MRFNEGEWSEWIDSQTGLFTRSALERASAELREKFECVTKAEASAHKNPVFRYPDDCSTPHLEPICGKVSGYDLPCLISADSKDGCKGVVMFCAQDPLRKEVCDGISVATFFGIDHIGYRGQRRHYGIVWKLVTQMVERGFDVWLTDANKLYCKEESISGALLGLSLTTLGRELDLLKPVRIVAFGKAATQQLSSYSGCPVRSVPHPASRLLTTKWAQAGRRDLIEDSINGRFNAKVDRYWREIWA